MNAQTLNAYDDLVMQIQKDAQEISKAVKELQSQNLGGQVTPRLEEIQQAAQSIFETAYCNLPRYAPEELQS